MALPQVQPVGCADWWSFVLIVGVPCLLCSLVVPYLSYRPSPEVCDEMAVSMGCREFGDSIVVLW